jgi:hypothetical protein
MMNFFSWFKTQPSAPARESTVACTTDGVTIAFAQPLAEPTVDCLLDSATEASPSETYLKALLCQLVDEGRCHLTREHLLYHGRSYTT